MTTAPEVRAPRQVIPALSGAIERGAAALLTTQQPDAHFVFELEADATIPAEYVLMRHYLCETPDNELYAKIGRYLNRIQGRDGGWPLFQDGAIDISASVKAYFALKVIGDDTKAPHMVRARDAIRRHGGAERVNVFTRIMLALFGIVRWEAVPSMPVELMLAPRWFPFHVDKISYWARTVMVPLLVLGTLKPVTRQSSRVDLGELFLQSPRSLGLAPRAPHQQRSWHLLFQALDYALRPLEERSPEWIRKRAIARAETFVTERLNGEYGLGAIFPAMVNAVLMMDTLGYSRQCGHYVSARRALDKLLIVKGDEAYCQPCVSPVWDTALACHAMLEVGSETTVKAAVRGLSWLDERQICNLKGDWSVQRPNAKPGGWAFQYENAHYPDVDDTSVVIMAMDRIGRVHGARAFDEAIVKGRDWIVGMQSRNGGWGAFDADNTYSYLNSIPFSDHGALLDPPTEDVTARCVSMLAQLGEIGSPTMKTALRYLHSLQRRDGSWYGRWGINYIYGTWSVLSALQIAATGPDKEAILRATRWLASIQNEDGGWGEDGTSYKLAYDGYERAPSTASQTAWALLGLMAAGEVESKAVACGIDYLVRTQRESGFWDEERFTAVGFPRVFYLRYHGYAKYFPVWALARYRNLKMGRSANFGM